MLPTKGNPPTRHALDRLAAARSFSLERRLPRMSPWALSEHSPIPFDDQRALTYPFSNTANNSSMQAITAYNSTTRFGSSVSSGKPLPKVQARDIPQYPHLEVWPNPSEGIRQEFSIPSDASTAISSPNPQHQCGNGGVRADSIV